MEILLKKLVWPGLAVEANFLNICLLGTSCRRIDESRAMRITKSRGIPTIRKP